MMIIMMIMNIEYIWLNKKNETNFAIQNYFCHIWSCVFFSIWCGISFYVVLFHMHLQITRPFAGVVALLAGKRFLAGVWKHVILHTTVVTARIVALFTSKGLFSSVSELVSLQILRLSGGIVTLLTTERLLSEWIHMQIILNCFVQIKVPPHLANHLNQLIYSSFAPPRPGDFDPCSAPPRRFWPLPCPGPAPKILTLAPPCRKKPCPVHPWYALKTQALW